ncbi:MAG: hypothetical protein DCC67_01180 [Planctomycetota bacterium]|nr:MAG: hypothetical protein DCC67_01180 [Planctomycetota bacterium]
MRQALRVPAVAVCSCCLLVAGAAAAFDEPPDDAIAEPPLAERGFESSQRATDEGATEPPDAVTDPPTTDESPSAPVVSVAPTTAAGYRGRNGETIAFELIGSDQGSVWGDGLYADDSDLATAAVHAGVLKPGEKGVVRVTILPGADSYAGATRHGVTSRPYKSWLGSFRFPDAPAAEGEAAPPPSEAPPPSDDSSPPAAAASRTVEVWPLAVWRDSQGVSHGSCSRLGITLGGHAAGDVRVGFFESEVGGSGPQWRSAGWTAALTAAQLSDFDPRTLQASFDISGWIDGPSAGALMTVGILAAARGDALRDDASMTGTINPDGIIGPVGGIAHKIEGAAQQGKKLVLIPAGIAYQRDNNREEDVHLVRTGEKLGVEVVPVLDVYAAYRLLTGVDLPRPAAERAGRLGGAVDAAVYEATKAWALRDERAMIELNKIPVNYRRTDEGRAYLTRAIALSDLSDNLENEGEMAAMLHDYVQCVANGYFALEMARCELVYQTRGKEAMIARVRDNAWLASELESAGASLRNFQPANVEQLAAYLEAVDAFLAGASYREAANMLLRNLPTSSEEAELRAARRAAIYQIRAWVNLKLASDYVTMAADYDGPPIPADAPLAMLADFYRRAGEANAKVFEALIIQPAADAEGMTAAQVKFGLMISDEEYGVLETGGGVTASLSRWFPPGVQHDYASLAAGLFAYCRSAMLVAKYYSLDAELGDQLEVVGLRRERTFADWLAGSADEAERNIHRLRDGGLEAAVCRQYLDVAQILRNRDLPSRIESLSYLFRVNVLSRVMWRVASPAASP